LLAAAVDRSLYGRAFGFERAADHFPKNRLLAGGYGLAALMALGIMFLPANFWLLTLVFMLGGVQIAIEETLEDSFCAELVESAQHGMAFGVLATATQDDSVVT
jgi:MFS family permease